MSNKTAPPEQWVDFTPSDTARAPGFTRAIRVRTARTVNLEDKTANAVPIPLPET
ncbi:hypothetical protein [Aliikangiella marina]|uniref:hypothetical protein n=1 Tax=Aliikangiella marina TaxID=1712262 RepID=UPI00163D4B16|nr:hypothetical protein [Aliikangiella marina]